MLEMNCIVFRLTTPTHFVRNPMETSKTVQSTSCYLFMHQCHPLSLSLLPGWAVSKQALAHFMTKVKVRNLVRENSAALLSNVMGLTVYICKHSLAMLACHQLEKKKHQVDISNYITHLLVWVHRTKGVLALTAC